MSDRAAVNRLSLTNVVKRFGAATVVRGVELQVTPGEFVVFVGPSGCGKSTLLRMIAGLEPVTEGEIAIDDEPVNHLPPAQRGIAMVFQSYALYPHMTAYKNMAFGLETAGLPKAVVKERVTRAARILRIEDLLSRKPRHLSGGQRQRVAIGRAIVRDPKIFLFDEPLSNLDAELRVQMRVEIAKLHADLKATMIYVTHDQVEAMTMADKIVVLSDGRIEQVGAPLDVYNSPRNRFVAGFIGSPKMNFLETKVVGTSPLGVEVSISGGPPLTVGANPKGVARDSVLTLGIRPEHLTLSGGEQAMSLRVTLAEQLGDKTLLYGSLPDGQSIVAQVPGQRPVRTGEPVPICLDPQFCHLFRSDGDALPRTADP